MDRKLIVFIALAGSLVWNNLRIQSHGSNLFIKDLNQTVNNSSFKCIVQCNVYPQDHHKSNNELDVTCKLFIFLYDSEYENYSQHFPISH